MTDLVIKGCDEKFAEMITNIYKNVLLNQIKCGVQINFSGNQKDFSYIYTNVHPDCFTKVIKNNYALEEVER